MPAYFDDLNLYFALVYEFWWVLIILLSKSGKRLKIVYAMLNLNWNWNMKAIINPTFYYLKSISKCQKNQKRI